MTMIDYFFSGNQYIRVTRGETGPGTVDPGYPAPISNWGWGAFGANGINAALYSGGPLVFGEGERYVVSLDSFHIDNTRAVHEDTDYVTLNAQVNKQPALTRTVFVGDVNNGDHPVNIQLGPLEVGPNDALTFNYVILNKGHTNGDRDKIEAGLGQAAGAALGAAFGGSFWSLVGTGIGKLISIIDADCDGVVAADQIAFVGTNLKQLTASGRHRETRHYPGTDSAVGCGSNSDYKVTWTIQRTA
jgi:hypothetical protein